MREHAAVTRGLLRSAAAAGFAFALCLPAGWAQAEADALPGGATSLQETHGDWTVACRVQAEGGKLCSFSQEQLDQRSRQRVLAIELRPAADGGVQGSLLLPFGLALDYGVSLQIDEAEQGFLLGFRTCLPAGCLVPIDSDAEAVAALRNGARLAVTTVAAGGAETAFSISLRGFAGALDRTEELLR